MANFDKLLLRVQEMKATHLYIQGMGWPLPSTDYSFIKHSLQIPQWNSVACLAGNTCFLQLYIQRRDPNRRERKKHNKLKWTNLTQPTNSIEQSPSLKANSHSATQEIPCLLWNLKIHYCVHKGLPLVKKP
jgi:hypothetical protein